MTGGSGERRRWLEAVARGGSGRRQWREEAMAGGGGERRRWLEAVGRVVPGGGRWPDVVGLRSKPSKTRLRAGGVAEAVHKGVIFTDQPQEVQWSRAGGVTSS